MSDEPNRAWKDQYMLRFPDGMRDRLKEEAAKNNRSMNAEIIARLEASFSETPEGAFLITPSMLQQMMRHTLESFGIKPDPAKPSDDPKD